MKRNALKAGFAISALALAVSPAMAVDLRFDGFASFVAGQALDKDELVNEEFRGFTEDMSYQDNSLFALQVRADLQDKLSATAQIIAKGAEGYNARFNWAYFKYEINNELSVRAGRFRSPLFIYSDFLDVGYAYHWIEPPATVYDLSGFDSTDGIQLEHQTNFGNWTSSLAIAVGATRADLSLGSLESTNAWTVSWSLNYDWFTFHAVHSGSEVTISADAFDQLADALVQIPGITEEAVDNMLMDSDNASFDGVGISIDTGKFFAVAEVVMISTEDAFPADPAFTGYVSAGMRVDELTYYVTVENAHANADEQARDALLGPIDNLIANLPPAIAAQVGQLRFGVDEIFRQTDREEMVYNVGIRYNFHPSAAFKVEYTMMDDKIERLSSDGTYDTHKPSAIAVAVDLVY